MIFSNDRYDSIDYYFPERLRLAMDEKGLEPKDFEDLGIASSSSIREYLDNGRLPNLRMAYKIAEFLDVKLDWLCGLDEDVKWADSSRQTQLIAPWRM